MKKYSVSFEIDFTFLELFENACVSFIDDDNIGFNGGKICVPLSVGFVASRLSRIERNFGMKHFSKCKQNIDNAYKEYQEKKIRQFKKL